MKERPIIFSGEMVRAILEGRKTQTRRIVKNQNSIVRFENNAITIHGWIPSLVCPNGSPGDRLWVRETVCIAPRNFATPDETCLTDSDGFKRYVSYKADGHSEDAMRDYKLNWTPSIHMPRWASRITLEIVSLRVERLQGISEEDAKAEGIEKKPNPWNGIFWKAYTKVPTQSGDGEITGFFDPRNSFKTLWHSCYGPESWDANPWVWVIEFKKL